MNYYDVIVCDPPWHFGDSLKKMKSKTKRSAQSQYKTLTVSDITKLPVKSLANPLGSVLVLWVPSTMLKDGLMVMESWGFVHKQTFVWVKVKKNALERIKNKQIDDLNNIPSFGMGRLFRQCHELALIGTMGKVYDKLQDKSQRSVLFDVNAGHSVKPEALQDRLEKMFPTSKKLEMFARRVRVGWDCVGDDIDGSDIRDSLEKVFAR